VWTGGTPVPGATCITAPALTRGLPYSGTTPAAPGVEQWYLWHSAAGLRVFASTGLSAAPGVTAELWEGIKCGVATLLATVTLDVMALVVTGPNVWLKIVDAGGGATPYTFNLT